MQEQQISEGSSSSIQPELSGGKLSAPEPTSQSTSDPALSLRAVALSTLKSKRRKVASSQPFSNLSRPVITDNSVQLDYGQEDHGTSHSDVRSAQSSLNKSDPSEDLQAREEGEISDSEEPSASRKTIELPPEIPPISTDVQPRTSEETQSPQVTTVLKTESPPPSNLLDRISDLQIPTSIPGHHHRRSSESSHAADNMDVDATTFVDENHVRPGLNMNQHQYDTAKDIILDLLGWGVPPGYLIDCGLSQEIVFYVFSELNLRLPEGFDTHGLIPFNPSTVRMLIRDPSTPSVAGFSSTSDVDSSSKSATSSDAHTLHDMEKQRRQELLARKAVNASRKGKAPMTDFSPNGLPTEPHKGDVEMSVPTETVDDFLKTIESGDEPRQDHTFQQGHEDGMDVDYTTLRDQFIHQDYVHTPTEPPTSSDSFGHISRRSSSSGDISVCSNGQKRGTKRPVAADFVDFDTDLRVRNGYSHPTLKRKAGGSFVSISTTRRCVIDLSDDDDGGASVRLGGNEPVYESPAMVVVSEVNGGYSTPPVGGSSISTPRLSPGVLAEKERQIEEMRQMIAQREKCRFDKIPKSKKTASASTNGTLTPETFVSVKQEEDELPLATETVKNSTTNGTINQVNAEPTAIETIGVTANEQNDDHSSVASTPPPMEESKEISSANQTSSQASDEAPVTQTESDQADIVQDLQPREQTTEMVDVEPKLSSSAQAKTITSQHHPRHDENQGQSQEKLEDHYPAYQSIFHGYPLLRSSPSNLTEDRSITRADEKSSISSNSSTHFSTSSVSTTSTLFTSLDSSASFSVQASHLNVALPDLNPLKLGALIQSLDPSKRICQYEIPGGGVCRDAGCEDNHLSRMVAGVVGSKMTSTIEPSDQDTAKYLANFVPESWLMAHGSMVTSKMIAALEEARVKNSSMTFDERVASAMATLQSQFS